MATARRPRRGWRPARRCACRRCRRRPPRRRPALDIDPNTAKDLQHAVLYRDDQLIVLNKPPGLPVQGGPGITHHLDGLLDALRFGAGRPRLVHRLDRDTSGVLVLARTPGIAGQARRRLSRPRGGEDLLGGRRRPADAAGGPHRPAAAPHRRRRAANAPSPPSATTRRPPTRSPTTARWTTPGKNSPGWNCSR